LIQVNPDSIVPRYEQEVPPNKQWPVVLCPGCRVPMVVKQVDVDGPGRATGKVIYVCRICKTETARRYKDSGKVPAKPRK
jgi:hypothetical protein